MADELKSSAPPGSRRGLTPPGPPGTTSSPRPAELAPERMPRRTPRPLAEFYGVYAGEPLTSSKRVRRMKKRRWLAAAAALFLVILCGALLSPQRVLAADVKEEDGEIKIFVTARSGSIGWLYDFYQGRQLARFCSESPDVPRHAIVTFDGFYGAEYVEELFAGMDSIDTLYA